MEDIFNYIDTPYLTFQHRTIDFKARKKVLQNFIRHELSLHRHIYAKSTKNDIYRHWNRNRGYKQRIYLSIK